MTPARVRELLLGRSLLASTTDKATIVWVDPVPSATERVLQEELVRLFNEQSLMLQGRRLHLRVGDPTDPTRLLEPIEPAQALRVSG
jgi:hypothetical protein